MIEPGDALAYLVIRKNFLMEKVVKRWNVLLREVMESSSLKVFKRHVDVSLRFTDGFAQINIYIFICISFEKLRCILQVPMCPIFGLFDVC